MAIALFGGAYIADKRFAFIVPLLAMVISDSIIGFHSTFWAVYFSIGIGVFIGFMLNKKVNTPRVIYSSLTSSVIFFIVTNLAVWLVDGMYPLNFSGLIQCYTMALPFFRNSLAGDLVYCGILFGSYALMTRYIPYLKPAEA
jgi:uncharacterized membrane protein